MTNLMTLEFDNWNVFSFDTDAGYQEMLDSNGDAELPAFKQGEGSKESPRRTDI